MRKISPGQIEQKVYQATLKANFVLRKDVLDALKSSYKAETKPLAKEMLGILIENAQIAKREKLAICQDTGMAVVFCKIGNNVQIVGDINKAINKGVKDAYRKGFLRKSVVNDPLLRKNTGTNTPCVIHYEIIKADKIKISVMPKGFGSENSSFIKMFNPTASFKEITDFIINKVKEVAVDACPPVILGIGIGGTLDKAAILAKEALLKKLKAQSSKLKSKNSKGKRQKSEICKLEKEILERLNKTGIGPMGLGGRTTCLGVNILTFPTHIAGLPVCVNVSCHALRNASATI